jgi:hypothetical protein
MKPIEGVRTLASLGRLVAGIVFATLVLPLDAQTAPAAHAPFSLGYDKAHEITVIGTIRNLTSESISGSPFGVHLFVAGSQGVFDVHLGPYLGKETQEALHAGIPVQVLGATETIRGKGYLLARQLIFAGRMLTVRNENGLLVRMPDPRARSKRDGRLEKTSEVEPDRGAQ